MKEIKLRYLGRKWAAAALAGTMMLGMIPGATAAEIGSGIENLMETAKQTSVPDYVTADWKFGEEGVKSGAIADGNLVIKDQTGNGNDLRMQVYKDATLLTGDHQIAQAGMNWEDYLSFSDDSMTGKGGSMVFNGDNGTVEKAERDGADFVTVDGAPINKNEFRNGYTLEMVYYLPDDWTAADRWMALMARQVADPETAAEGMGPDKYNGSMSVAISNCKEVQYATCNADNKGWMSSAWSVSMDQGGVWYHIVVVSNGQEVSTYVNGCEAFRDFNKHEMIGMFADPKDGRFRVGSSWWTENGGTVDRFLQGSLQEIRISQKPLEREDWLIPNPEDYVENFGSNEEYELRNEDNYNIVLLPDTQNTVEFRPDVMKAAINGLIASADKLNVIGVVGLGDVVDDVDKTQYDNATCIFNQLPKAGIKTLMQPGNHDGWRPEGDCYSQAFGGDSKFVKDLSDWYLTTKAWSGCMFVRGGDRVYMILSLAAQGNGKTAWNTNNEELDWFKSMLEKYKDIPTIVTTHDVQNCSDTQPSAVKLSEQGEKLWELVKGYDQVFMMVGGHSHGAGVQILKNDNNKDVISILTDYQFAYNGGNGWFRYLEFDETANKIYYSSYSPYAASLDEDEKTFFDVNFLEGEGNRGEIDWNFEERFAGLSKAPIAVLSDVHLYDAEELGSTGTAFNQYLASDRKLLNESEAILDAALKKVAGSGAQYLLIPGDLTKDGEKINHKLLAEKLAALEETTGIEVFVINGNHDISNAHAVRFNGDTTEKVDTVDTEEFQDIYEDFGYGQAVAQDPNSLSYAVDLGEDYRLIVMDACIYNNDKANPNQETGGEFGNDTLNWVLAQIKAAVKAGRRPIGMMHHGLVPHTGMQPTMFSEYLVKDYETVANTLADAGMNLVFTGHFHSQDTSSIKTDKGNVLDDVETGSLVTSPCPIRYVRLSDDSVSYTTEHVEAIEGMSNFKQHAANFLQTGMEGLVEALLPGVLMQNGVPANQAQVMAKQLANQQLAEGVTVKSLLAGAFAAHYAGDEQMTEDVQAIVTGLAAQEGDAATKALYQLLAGTVTSLYTDSDPADCKVSGLKLSDLPTYPSGGGSSHGGSSSGKKPVTSVTPVTPVPPEKLPFADVADNAWYHDAVEYVYNKGVMSGISASTFAPNQKLSRAMVAQILYGLEGKPASGEQIFTDVKDGQWFAKAVNWAAKEGLVSGYGDGTFGPDDNVTREQLAAILRGYAKYKGGDAAQGSLVVNGFRDGESISTWALEAMNWAVNAQLMTGKGGNTLDPQGNAARAEVAQMLMNFLEKVG